MSNGQLFDDDGSGLDPKKVLAHISDPVVLKRWEGTLREMVEIAEASLQDQLGESDQVPLLARHVVFGICDAMGGSIIYLPRGERLKIAMRDVEIFKLWRERDASPAVLARKYRLAVQTIYDIIARQRALHRRSEPDLFGFDEGTIN
ncbi:Mor transcription activator family protein [Stutzerimonas kirkiae]|uniref:Mor transcription activator family protein n=1 Tax=Stutzerimonas kirkiae TaxID=2211392 RepID=UPI0010383579|nr:Mor transcription activator family protein [Stutzerimonas kirkiae]TBV12773.1 transcriptional regulator [Stutzerimonas kirkiae]